VSLIDALLVGAIVVGACVWMFARRRGRWLLAALLALAALALLQIAVEGFYWQFLPGYLLAGLIALLAAFHRRDNGRPGRIARLLGGAGLVAMMLAAMAPWAVLPPVPQLTKPEGPYDVGTQIFRWVDVARPEEATSDSADRRNVIAQAWYPIAAGTKGAHAGYIDGLRDLPAQVTVFPRWVLSTYGGVDTRGVLDAPISEERPRWPVVVFLTGNGAPRAFYSGLVSGLASMGYVVLAIDHPYEAAVTELADGRIVSTIEKPFDNDPGMLRFMKARLDLRINDVRFALDQVGRPEAIGPTLAGHLDLDRIAAIGHSLGGAAAALAMDADDRIKAAANIDGTLYGGVSAEKKARPFLLLDSDHAESGHSDGNITGNRLLFEHFGGGWRYEMARANHFGFTDAPLFFAPPARFVLTQLIGGSRGPAETQRATVKIVDAFLKGPLTGTPASIEDVVAGYEGITGGLISTAMGSSAVSSAERRRGTPRTLSQTSARAWVLRTPRPRSGRRATTAHRRR
jgi:dienelactone hydrolase